MEKIIKNLEFLKSSTDKTCQYLSGMEVNTIQLFCLGLLRRINDTTTTKVLFELLPDNNKHEFSIGIMFRVLVLDTLISMNLYKLIKELDADNSKSSIEKETEIESFCNTFLSDGLSSILNYIQQAQTWGMKTKEETEKTFKNIVGLFTRFFENYNDDGTRPKLKYSSKYTANQLFEKLAKDNDLKEISKIYDSYAYLSKYDHFGIVYFQAINEVLDSKLKIYSNTSEVFVAHNALIHVLLARHSSNDKFINEQKDFANEYLLQHIIDKTTANKSV